MTETQTETRLLEAIRLTQEYAQLPAVDGWSWFDAYRSRRPEDAERLRQEWLGHRGRDNGHAIAPPEADQNGREIQP